MGDKEKRNCLIYKYQIKRKTLTIMKNLTINGKLYTASESIYDYFKKEVDERKLNIIFNLALGVELFEVK